MRVLMVGAGGVGDAAARIAAERPFFEAWVVADYDLSRAQRTVDAVTSRHSGRAASAPRRWTPRMPVPSRRSPARWVRRTSSTRSTRGSS